MTRSEEWQQRFFGPSAGREILRVRRTADSIDSYVDRNGYEADFLGHGEFLVGLPGLGTLEDDVAYRQDVEGEYVLPYRHFSVAVSRSRRLPIYSAVNVDGKAYIPGVERTNVWKRDPRISDDYQILEECYGHSGDGYFSRGHMTRREDPNWGTPDIAIQADADTFHATNVAPQAQSFNSPIWLGLENYLLEHAAQDSMRINVFSGPVLANEDPVLFGIKIPVNFWKIVVFIHEKTNRLCATAYIASQAQHIPGWRGAQFVFGKYKDWQVPISTVELATGLVFGHLHRFDPLHCAGERFALRLDSLKDAYFN